MQNPKKPENSPKNAEVGSLPTLSQVFGKHEIRAVERDGEVWLVASDVAKVLGYRDAANLTRRLMEDEKGYSNLSTLGGDQEVAIINEAGTYRAIFASSRQEAEAFKRWVLHDLLPTLRRTGFYSLREEVVTANAIARAYGVGSRFIPDYMGNHRIEPVGMAEDPDTGKLRLLYPKRAVMEIFMLGSGMRDGFELRSYSGAWEPIKTKTLEAPQ